MEHPARETFRDMIHVRDAAIFIGHNDGAADALENPRGSRFALSELSQGDDFTGYIVERTEEAGDLSIFEDGIEGVIEVSVAYAHCGRERNQQLFVKDSLSRGESLF
jgi:hypothetical protein